MTVQAKDPAWLALPLGFDPPAGPPVRIAVVCHVFYDELAAEMASVLSHLPAPADIFLSTDSAAKAARIGEAFGSFRQGTVEIRIVPNRGRDIAPRLIAFRDVLARYPLVAFLHAKGSKGDLSRAWRRHLFGSLIGRTLQVQHILWLFARDPTLGMIMPTHWEYVPYNLGWLGNHGPAERIAQRLGIALDALRPPPFPAGSMFWARSAALSSLLALDLQYEAFEPETGQKGGTLAHGIERLFAAACERSGFRWLRVSDPMLANRRDQMRAARSQAELVRMMENGAGVGNALSALPPAGVEPPQSDPAGTLYRAFLNRGERRNGIHKWHHYFDIYERHFAPWRGQDITLLEIGVQRGGSQELWRSYFGPRARIFGIDIDPRCASITGNGRVFIGDQADRTFLRRVLAETGRPHIVIDDGGHTMNQMITSFEEIYPRMQTPGVYLVEDTHTCFWPGQYQDRPDGQTFLQYAAARFAELHQWSGPMALHELTAVPPIERSTPMPVTPFGRDTKSIAFYDSIVVFERQHRAPPWHEIR
ncbi:hypothetical protein STVA_54340 [Allostella vacuolata]|nr:hypothetical protein STVA_54340 [Stella vacuolata]